MVEQRKFSLSKGPYIRKADFKQNTSTMMFDFLLALTPLIIFAWYKNGIMPYNEGTIGFIQMLYPLLFVLIGGLTAVVVEGLYYSIFSKEENVLEKIKHSFAVIPGVLLAMVLPLYTPIWVLVIGVIFGVVIGKLIFGGFGYNLFNPALVGYIFIVTAFYGVITATNKGYLNGSEINIVTGATPLTNFFSNFPNGTMDQALAPYGSLTNFFIGTIPGSIAETSSLLCLLALVYLLVRRVINWRIPLVYLGTVLVLSIFLGYFLGYTQDYEVGNKIIRTLDYRFPLFNLFSGGLMFGAVFMATEPVTSPRTPNGKIVFALFLGAITIMLRYLGKPEGVASSILFMNIFTPLLDSIFAKVRVSDNRKKVILTYVYVGIGVLAVFGFTLMQLGA